MHHPGQNTPANYGPGNHPKNHAHDGHPKVKKYDELTETLH